MFNTAKRFFAFFVLTALVGAVPVFANPLKRDLNANTKTFNIELHGVKRTLTIGKIITRDTVHSYRVNLRQGETAVFTLRSDKATTLRVKSPEGRITEQSGEKLHQAVLTGVGEFVIEVGSAEISAYTLSVAGN